MQEETNLLIQEYAKNPLRNYQMNDAMYSSHEGNFICGDDITVYIKIEAWKVSDYSFAGNCSTVTTAAASFLSEFILGANIEDVLTWNYDTMVSNWFEVSNRRKRAAVIAIMAARNAIHQHLHDWVVDEFSIYWIKIPILA